jgi:hypothetical protein
MNRPKVYGDEKRFKSALDRHVARGGHLLDQAEGVTKRMAVAPGGPNGLAAYAIEQDWAGDVERWRRTIGGTVTRYLGEDAEAILPNCALSWPPKTGKPRHERHLEWVELWLRDAVDELQRLRGVLGVSKNVATVSPPPARFAELRASGLVDVAVIDGYAKDMGNPKTPKQLADAIGAAKEATEATLRAALDQLNEPYGATDDLPKLMKKWRGRVDTVAPPDPTAKGTLDNAQAALGNLVSFLAAWRNSYGRGHGRPKHPPGLRARHARLAVDGAETAVRFIVTTMDDLGLLPP